MKEALTPLEEVPPPRPPEPPPVLRTSEETDAMMLAAAHPYGHEEPPEIRGTGFVSSVRDGFVFEEGTLEELPLDEVVEGVNRELDLMKSFPVYQAVPRAEVTGKVWSTRWCYRRKGPKQVSARFVVRQFANSLDANFYSPAPGLEVTRVLSAMPLSKDLTIMFGDISVAFMNTPTHEGDPVYVERPEGLYEHNNTVWCLKRALNGLRDASRLFREHFSAVLTSRLGFTRSEAQPTLFVDLARNVFIVVHVDDLIMVGSSSQLYEVVGEMKQYFTMKVTHPLSASSTQTYVGARYLRHGDAIWELPTARYVTGMLKEHGKKDAKPVVTPAVNRNDDDGEDEEVSAEEHRILRRIVGKSQFLAPRRPDIAFATNRLARSLAKPSKSDIIASERLLRYLRVYARFRTEASSAKESSTLTVFTDSDWAGDRPTRKSVSSWVIMLGGSLISAGARTQSVIAQSSREAVHRSHRSHE